MREGPPAEQAQARPRGVRQSAAPRSAPSGASRIAGPAVARGCRSAGLRAGIGNGVNGRAASDRDRRQERPHQHRPGHDGHLLADARQHRRRSGQRPERDRHRAGRRAGDGDRSAASTRAGQQRGRERLARHTRQSARRRAYRHGHPELEGRQRQLLRADLQQLHHDRHGAVGDQRRLDQHGAGRLLPGRCVSAELHRQARRYARVQPELPDDRLQPADRNRRAQPHRASLGRSHHEAVHRRDDRSGRQRQRRDPRAGQRTAGRRGPAKGLRCGSLGEAPRHQKRRRDVQHHR